MREQISLNGTWQLKGTASYVPLRDKSMETGKPLEGVTGWMDAQVPGGVARALYQAGYIDHPYVDMNSLKCEWIENRWWIYRREFDRRRRRRTDRPAGRAERPLPGQRDLADEQEDLHGASQAQAGGEWRGPVSALDAGDHRRPSREHADGRSGPEMLRHARAGGGCAGGRLRRHPGRVCHRRPHRHDDDARPVQLQAVRAVLHPQARRRRHPQLRGVQGAEDEGRVRRRR